jgi:hypothetical protein
LHAANIDMHFNLGRVRISYFRTLRTSKKEEMTSGKPIGEGERAGVTSLVTFLFGSRGERATGEATGAWSSLDSCL